MIFRKENRGESFQRQISNLRNQIQPDDEPADADYTFAESENTSQFTSGLSSAESETYVPVSTRGGGPTAESFGAAQMASPQAPTSYRGSWQTADANTSVIAANTHWNGTLRSDGSLHIHGRADGELHAANDLFVAEGAEIDAELFADNVVVAGTVRGRVEARSRLEVLPAGHVAGDVKAPKLVVHEGARLSGQLKMESGSSTGSGPAQYSTATPTPTPGPKSRRNHS